MDIKWVEDFLSLAAMRSFSRAAEQRNVTQPAFSRRIRALETWVGTQLVDRSTYPLTLTAAGKLFRDSAGESLRLLQDTRAMLHAQHTSASTLRLSAGHSLALNFIPDWLQQLKKSQPGISTRVVATDVHDSVLSLIEGDCDLLLCYHHPQLPINLDPDQYDYLTIGTESVLPVSLPARSGAPAFALPGSKGQALEVLSYASASFFGRVVELILAGAGRDHHFSKRFESDMAELLKRMALKGGGMAWLPRRSIAQELDEGRLVRAGDHHWSLELEIRLFRARANTRPALLAIWQALSQQAI
ncbi:MAG TPA: LysR family transcriptional regulator [Janthinobacterium sp.]|nr:LysR family transcriptional regulator [Janthinobacterium sp.]